MFPRCDVIECGAQSSPNGIKFIGCHGRCIPRKERGLTSVCVSRQVNVRGVSRGVEMWMNGRGGWVLVNGVMSVLRKELVNGVHPHFHTCPPRKERGKVARLFPGRRMFRVRLAVWKSGQTGGSPTRFFAVVVWVGLEVMARFLSTFPHCSTARSPMLLNSSEFIFNLSLIRTCWIRGRVGGGKTLLSTAIAEHFLSIGLVDGVIANFPTVYPPSVLEDDGTLHNRFIIFDEAWETLDARSSVSNPREYGAYSRKFGVYWCFPSVYPIDKRLRAITVWRTYASPPLHLWFYRWSLDLDYDTGGGWFALFRPERYFNRYDNEYIPLGDGGISKRFQRSMHLATKGKRSSKPSAVDYQAALVSLGLSSGAVEAG